jgi:catechol 2,3-dioxygenase-like lactoylglutathione lyase family enzyme
MKRFHLHVAVADLDRSVGFYANLFGAAPSVVKEDYAKWMLEDPRLNFAISTRAAAPGLDHVGIQVDSGDELAELAGRLKAAGETTLDQQATTCCYARSDKAWVTDPSGLNWETFHTFGEATDYGVDRPADAMAAPSAKACCASAPESASNSPADLARACC